MPKVGKKKFPYTAAGMKAAKKASKKTGKKVMGMSSGAARGTAARRKKASKAARVRGGRMGYGG
jgi:hypothetical protein